MALPSFGNLLPKKKGGGGNAVPPWTPHANRVLLAPIGNPEPRGYSPLDTLLFSLKWCSHRKTAFSHVQPFFENVTAHALFFC